MRNMAGALWAAHSFLWSYLGGEAWMACAASAPVLSGYLAFRIIKGNWGPRVLPIAAILVVLSAPGHFTATGLRAAPTGLVAVVASFILFGFGTLAATTKHLWMRVEPGPSRK
jgi:hypothetical protein